MSKIVLTTRSFHPRDRFSYWHDVACKTFVEHDWRPADRRMFEADISATSFDALKLSVCTNSEMTIWRNERQAARATSDAIFVAVPIEGATILSQDGKDIKLERGGLGLIDSQRPYTLKFASGSKHIAAQISRRELEARVGDFTSHLACRLHDNGPGKVLTGFFHSLAAAVDTLPDFARPQLGTQAIDLLGLTLASRTDGSCRLSSVRMISLLRLKGAVERALSSSEATCADVALLAGMSVRYANQLLASKATSLERYILDCRIERCRQAFDDRRQDARTITDIAFSWGFRDVSHFGRVFKERHGLSPKQYRNRPRIAD